MLVIVFLVFNLFYHNNAKAVRRLIIVLIAKVQACMIIKKHERLNELSPAKRR